MGILDNIQGSGFKTPKNYFNSLEDKICDITNSEQKASLMQVPQGYFDDLEDKIMNAITDEPSLDKNLGSGLKMPEGYLNSIEDAISKQIIKKETKVIGLFNTRNLLYASSIAAAIVLIFSLYTTKQVTTFDNIDVELVEDYIINQDMDSYELAALLNDEDLNTENFIDSDIFGEAAETYLINNTDIEDLMNE